MGTGVSPVVRQNQYDCQDVRGPQNQLGEQSRHGHGRDDKVVIPKHDLEELRSFTSEVEVEKGWPMWAAAFVHVAEYDQLIYEQMGQAFLKKVRGEALNVVNAMPSGLKQDHDFLLEAFNKAYVVLPNSPEQQEAAHFICM